jgi:rhodanese-related sulfurtransferase
MVVFGCVVLSSAPAVCADEKFPNRAKYPNAPPISTADLKASYDQNKVVVVDVRSTMEFDVIHVKRAVHVPVAQKTFVDDIKNLVNENKGRIFVFYCNGVTCLKAYEAAERVRAALPGDIFFAYDAGVPEWAQKYPGQTLLFGKEILDPQKQLISLETFRKKCLPFDEFKRAKSDPAAIYFDVRDPIQNSGPLPGLENARNLPLDKFILFVQQKLEQDKTLYVLDQVGKQVEWLMYYLEDHGYKNYWFLDKGATGVLEKQEYKK